MVVAIMESEHYTWVGLGDTEKEACGAILKKWNDNQRELENRGYKTAEIYNTPSELMDYYGIHTYELNRGEAVFE